ncbi:MAG: class I SAM-dependent methyltransferase [Chloroflexota bacterium]
MSQSKWDDQAAQWYADKYGDHPSNLKIVEWANLQPTDVVLDIGCGSGTAVFTAAALVPQGKAIGIDPTQRMVEIAQEALKETKSQSQIEFLIGGAEDIPSPDDRFDVVLALNSLHHWANVDKGIEEVKRVLKKNGRFLIGEEQFSDRINEWGPERVIQALTGADFKLLNHSVAQFEDSAMDFFEFMTNK